MKKLKIAEGTMGSSCCAPEAEAQPEPRAKAAAETERVRGVVRERYGQAVKAVRSGAKASCCGSPATDPALGFDTDPITRDLYDATDTQSLPEAAVLASFGCGNPTALAELRPGEVVLDLGSGGGIDVLLSAKRVGPTGLAYGLDMTDEMLELANENKAKAGATNVIFLKGTIESIPLPERSVDVIISNCVINLSADKDAALREAFRVLKPGGRFAISDIVLRRPLPEEARKSMELWTGCIAGALLDSEYEAKLRAAGFGDIGIEPTRVYDKKDTEEMAAGASCCGGPDLAETLSALDGAVMSAFVRATKPLRTDDSTEREPRTPGLQVFDPAMCCSTGVCGPSVDPALARFAADLDWLKAQGVPVERFNLAQQPAAFAGDAVVKAALETRGEAALPLLKVNGEVKSSGVYPSREELAVWAGIGRPSPSLFTEAVAELVAIGAAVASNCEPCFKFHYDKARKLGVSREDMLRAVTTAQNVKDAPAKSMLELAERHLRRDGAAVAVPERAQAAPKAKSGGCC